MSLDSRKLYFEFDKQQVIWEDQCRAMFVDKSVNQRLWNPTIRSLNSHAAC